MRTSATIGAGLAAVALLAASCTAGTTSQAPQPAPAPGEQVTITVASQFTDRELDILNRVLDGFRAKHPGVTIESRGNQDDDKITQAIRGGNPPDVAISAETVNLGQFCSSGAWQDLGPYLARDRVDLEQIPQAVRDYTQYQGKRCAMPLLADVYGLYYNADAFARAGVTAPPRTTSELTELAKRLTEWNPDGSIKVAGFLPVLGSQANHPWNWAPQWGARWTDEQGRSTLGSDPAWQEMFRWQKELVDFYGWDRLVQFTAGLGQQYSADNAFQRGRIAMAVDGEYRTGFIEHQAPGLNYGTAPFPVSDSRPELYGTGLTTGTIVGVPRGADEAGAAWELVKYLTTDTGALVELADGLNNVPTTRAALHDPRLERSPQYQTFLDMFESPALVPSPASPNGSAYMKATEDFGVKWQSGQVADLGSALRELDAQIDAAKSLGGR
ncbi:carbohydrate ABC transporter substrate-binding protein (CUT1 family) [Saccharopolyspora erythraea NRRL 2338]|uniref:Probable sugar-binding periplasmic protein n=2 Tax=Saccharopolyspora erythraea TaxID=1836 RepID=A4FA33_SACEN|nr:extracellular solute-binding protein [Saccharopolyspora erythraea]EQD82818.1 sugar ABC transporter substrate-binding protein [Saccharopolyspora erythraea D]PFG94693.1 carbohydrate ABC transporter substrate-binding protein (CUT1 family) [Saccharopolyspora erythraea NRRL 2338]QRK91421.1 extracellular solute-binding protein [Saccharopolyspora erythraea]CAM00908.1 putative secreted sugar-binding protein [Saccharopolyspora erythraea NRRL 2338]